MGKGRLEAFSDGVIAIIITIMVLEMKVPHSDGLATLKPPIPFVTGWMGENHFHALPVALYGVVLSMAGFAYLILVRVLIRHHGHESALAKAIGSDFKGKVSLAAYLAAIPLALVHALIAMALDLAVAVMWLVPDRRIEAALKE